MMLLKIWWLKFLSVCLIVNFSLAQTIEKTENLESLIQGALQKNPDYLSIQKKAEAISLTISQASALPDPSLSLAVMNLPVNSFVFDQEPMTGKKIALMQMFPFPGKLGLKTNIAELQAKVAHQQVQEFKNKLIQQVKSFYFQLFLTEKSIEITKKSQFLLQQFVPVAETKYSVGKGLQQDLLKVQIELSKLTDKTISLQQHQKSLLFRLNKLVNRKIDLQFFTNNDLEKSESQNIELTYSLPQLQALGLEHRPLLQSWQLMIEKSKQNQKLAKLAFFPDFSLGVAYTQRDDLKNGMKMNDFFSAELKINLPLYFFKKQSRKVAETQLMVDANVEKYQAVKNELFFQIVDAFSKLEKNKELLKLYKMVIIPQANQALNSALSGYQVDQVDFITLLNNQMTQFKYELEYYRVLTEFHQNLAELEMVIGVRFDKVK